MDREKEKMNLDKKIMDEFEKAKDEVVLAKNDYLNLMYRNIYLDALVKVVDQNIIDKGKKDMNL